MSTAQNPAKKASSGKSRKRTPKRAATGKRAARKAIEAVLAEPRMAIERWAQGEDIPQLAPGEWLQVAASAPARFVWVVDSDRVLPLDDAEAAEQLWTLLRPALAAEDLAIALGWLSAPGLTSDTEAAGLLESRISAEAEECSWPLLSEALLTLARRGAPWRAARILEHQVEGVGLDNDEVAQVERVALAVMDGPLLAAMARSAVWRSDEVVLGRFAAAASTASLIDNFGTTTVPKRLRLGREPGARLQAAVWRILASRAEPEALSTVQELVVATAEEGSTAHLATTMTGLVQQTHGKAALASMVAVFLSGLHRTPAGEAIERWLMQHPKACLEEALDPFPDWLPRFDATALRRLCFRLLPELSAEQRGEIAECADLAGGPRAQVVHEELELLKS